uniref:Uncharacterized protein n=1 Tax=Colobus angolensis palliatus TaxID=336983 RepID=A0A2K5I704_COLAP
MVKSSLPHFQCLPCTAVMLPSPYQTSFPNRIQHYTYKKYLHCKSFKLYVGNSSLIGKNLHITLVIFKAKELLFIPPKSTNIQSRLALLQRQCLVFLKSFEILPGI